MSLNQSIKKQSIASNPEHSIWVNASAGTGKTKTLTDRVLRLLLNQTSPQNILCLTFTKSAAAEMSERIQTRLGKWATYPTKEDLQKDLFNLTGQKVSDQTCQQARELFSKILDLPGGLKIETIHAFCQSILQKFPIEAGLSPHFTVIDDLEAKRTLRDIKEKILLEGNVKGSEIKNIFQRLSLYIHETQFSEIIQSLINERSKIIYFLKNFENIHEIENFIAEKLFIPKGLSLENLIDKFCHRSFDPYYLEISSLLKHGSKTDQLKSERFKNFFQSPNLYLWDYISLFLTGDINSSNRTVRKNIITKKLIEKYPHLSTHLQNETDYILDWYNSYKALITKTATIDLIQIASLIFNQYSEIKQYKAQLDYTDLISKTTDLLLNPDQSQWILYKLDHQIDHILVDEAQDTSPEQWQIIQQLCEEFFQPFGSRSDKIDRTLFVVGDQKQSIYSFQGADPDIFMKMQQFFNQKAKEANKSWQHIDLDVSFRSARSVLSVVDQTFTNTLAADGIQDDDLQHLIFREKSAGKVELWPLVEPTAIDPVVAWKPPVENTQFLSPRKKLAHSIANHIADQINNKAILPSKNRPIEPQDITILFRKRSGLIDEIISSLKEKKIPVSGSDRLVLKNHIAIEDIMACFNFLLLSEDSYSLACLLKSPLIGFSEDDLFKLCQQRSDNITLWQCLIQEKDKEAIYSKAYSFLEKLLHQKDRLSVSALLSEILFKTYHSKTHYMRIIERLGTEAEDPLQEFISLVQLYEAQNISSLQEFVFWFESNHIEIKRSLDQAHNSVQLMTVHAAKGLQAPIVYLVDTVQKPKKFSPFLWDETGFFLWPPKRSFFDNVSNTLHENRKEKQKQEYNRLLYVAMTRAEDQLHICGWKQKQDNIEGSWYTSVEKAIKNCPDYIKIPSEFHPEKKDKLVLENKQLEQIEPPEFKEKTTDIKKPKWFTSFPTYESKENSIFSPSQLGQSITQDNNSVAQEKGQIIHKLIKDLLHIEPIRRKNACLVFFDQYSYLFESNEVKTLKEKFNCLINDPEFHYLFSQKAYAEVPLIGNINLDETYYTLSGQIDRVVFDKDKIIIVDFKTNKKIPTKISDIPKNYIQQLAAYCDLLEGIYPSYDLETHLIWVYGPSKVMLPKSLINSYRKSLKLSGDVSL